jgi:mono/diheme cytochrome c family protein
VGKFKVQSKFEVNVRSKLEVSSKWNIDVEGRREKVEAIVKPSVWVGALLVAGLSLPIAVLSAQSASPAPQAANAPAGDPAKGKELYLKYSCYACHGYAGHAGPGGRIAPMRMNLPGFTAFIRNPRRMPPYSTDVLPDSQAADLFAYISALPKSPAAKEIPLLNAILSEK